MAHRMIDSLSLERSEKILGERTRALLTSADADVPLIIYNTYLPSLPFYLRIHKPMPVMYHPGDDDILGSFYLAAQKPPPAPGYESALLTHDEFLRAWSTRKLFVFIKDKRLRELEGAKVLLESDDVALVTNDKG